MMMPENDARKLLRAGYCVTHDELHLIIKECPACRDVAWDVLLSEPQTHRDLRWILFSEAPGAEHYKVGARQELEEMELEHPRGVE